MKLFISAATFNQNRGSERDNVDFSRDIRLRIIKVQNVKIFVFVGKTLGPGYENTDFRRNIHSKSRFTMRLF